MIFPDFLELLRAFEEHRVAYAVIGGYAIGLHSEPRYTKDLDILITASERNASAVLRALSKFGAPISNLSVKELAKPGLLYVFGIPPLRVDILNRVKGADAAAIVKRAKRIKVAGTTLRVATVSDLIKLKKLAGRKQDLADIEKLRQARDGGAKRTLRGRKKV